MNNLFFLDFETTGLNPYFNDPIEVAIKKYNSNNYYKSLIIPKLYNIHYTYIPPKIEELTKITNELIHEEGKDKMKVTHELFEFIKENSDRGPIYIIAHNGLPFDFIILKKLMNEYNLFNKKNLTQRFLNRIKYIDTVLFAKLFLQEEYVKQSNLCRKFNIINDSEHRAMGDIIALEKIYIKLCEQYSYHNNYDYNYYIEKPELIIKNCFI